MEDTPTEIDLKMMEKDLDKIKLTDIQKVMIREQSDKIAEVLGVSKVTIRGYWIYSLIEWQKHIKMTTAETESKLDTTKEARIQQTNEIVSIFRKKVSRFLSSKGKEHLLNKAIEAMMKLYIDKYASRPSDMKNK